MNWDDLRVVRAVYQAGSYAAAGARLGVNETTVSRRLARLEDDLGHTLFSAADGTRRPTPYCEQIMLHAETMALQAEHISQLGESPQLVMDRRRITATDSMSVCLLSPRLPAFLREHPAITIDLLVSTQNVDFSRWEADVAIRLRKPDRGNFVISKLGEMSLFLLEPVAAEAQTDVLVSGYPPELSFTPESRYLASIGLSDRARFTTTNLLAIRALLETGQFSGVLPHYMCQDLLKDPSFRATQLPERRSAWLLIQPHLKNDAPTRAVVNWIKACFKSVR